MTTLTLLDLARAGVKAARYRTSHPDLAHHSTQRYEAMKSAFGWTASLGPEKAALESLAEGCIERVLEIRSPFAGNFEAPPEILDLYQRFGPEINDHVVTTATAIEELLAEILADLCGLPADSSIDSSILAKHGLDPELPFPDPIDYI